jgi:light-regulated signal transduction histidine kinase (bacteriophytochrome)
MRFLFKPTKHKPLSSPSQYKDDQLHNNLTQEIESLKIENAKLKEQLMQAQADMDQFMYIASHDLQEPLRMIGSYSTLISNSFGSILPDDGKRWLHYVSSAASKMQRKMIDLLTYTRLGTLDSQPTVLDTNKIVEETLAILQSQVIESNARIQTSQLPPISGHRALISSLFQNILANSLKFTKQAETPDITISATQKGNFIEFTISDNGIGIRPESLERVFVLFQRLNGENEYPGNGVGLAICKRIVEKHGGDISVTSLVGMGSSFVFTLPTPS